MIETIIGWVVCLVIGFVAGFLVFRKHQTKINNVEDTIKK